MNNVNLTSEVFACAIAQFLDDKSAKDITILNISNVSSLADYFVIVSGDSTVQVKALMENTKDKVKSVFAKLPVRTEKDSKNRWNLLDYGDVVVHILHKDERQAYALEKFWSHAFSITEDQWRKLAAEYSEYNTNRF